MRFSLQVDGLEEVKATLGEKAPERIKQHIARGLLEFSARVVETIQESISTAYPPPSAPGEPPHLRTGALRRSAQIESVDEEGVTISVGGENTGAPYAAALEFGTARMAPRPFVQPVLNVAVFEAADIVKEAVERNLQEAVK